MKKLSSSFPNMVVVLTLTTVLAGFLLGFVHSATEDARRQVDDERRMQALQMVAADFDNDPVADKRDITLSDGSSLTLYPTRKGEQPTGAVVESYSTNGFSGKITVMVGLKPDGEIIDYQVTEHAETPGLGAKMNDWFRSTSARAVAGRNPIKSPLVVSKDGGEVDGITAATISSRAFLDALNRAAEALDIYLKSGQRSQRASTYTD